ncbi:MAG: hypothetical protein M3394_01440 [Actinomycetota bacterium]|nr:hypothetical protein [Actinomycetota bacterium]
MAEDGRDLRGKVGDATRAAIDAGGQAGLNLTEWRALSGVIYFTVSYGRSADRVSTLRLAAHVGINPDGTERVRMRETGRALRSLRKKGIIVYEPSSREGTASLIGLHPSVLARVSPHTPKGVATDTGRVSKEHHRVSGLAQTGCLLTQPPKRSPQRTSPTSTPPPLARAAAPLTDSNHAPAERCAHTATP